MNKPYVFIPALLMLGAVAGIAMTYSFDHRQDDAVVSEAASNDAAGSGKDAAAAHPMASAFLVSQATDSERIQALEQQIELLGQRVKQLERESTAGQNARVKREGPAGTEVMAADSPAGPGNQGLTTENLVKAGIDEILAADIVRRKNEVDLQRLELRDRAIREGYLGTSQYSRELDTLLEQDFALRDEIGDGAYDRYLYSTGQSNRVNIASVMQGSAADQAGLKKGDVILNYADQRLFNWNELQEATTSGVRGEYVNVMVMRNGQIMNLWLPRGPLGVRLSSLRLQP